jgi:hypothetical protein
VPGSGNIGGGVVVPRAGEGAGLGGDVDGEHGSLDKLRIRFKLGFRRRVGNAAEFVILNP